MITVASSTTATQYPRLSLHLIRFWSSDALKFAIDHSYYDTNTILFMGLYRYIMLHCSVDGIEDAGTETETNLFHELYYHFLGTDQSEDVLCWRDSKHAQWFSRAEITDDGQVIVLEIAPHTSSRPTLQRVCDTLG